MLQRPTSTTASGHVGTGAGSHRDNWIHYNPPQGRPIGGDGSVFTKFDYNGADTAIRVAASINATGGVRLSVTKFIFSDTHKCSNCQGEVLTQQIALSTRNGCSTREGLHNWRPTG